jgi:hypothetical protein
MPPPPASRTRNATSHSQPFSEVCHANTPKTPGADVGCAGVGCAVGATVDETPEARLDEGTLGVAVARAVAAGVGFAEVALPPLPPEPGIGGLVSGTFVEVGA